MTREAQVYVKVRKTSLIATYLAIQRRCKIDLIGNVVGELQAVPVINDRAE